MIITQGYGSLFLTTQGLNGVTIPSAVTATRGCVHVDDRALTSVVAGDFALTNVLIDDRRTTTVKADDEGC